MYMNVSIHRTCTASAGCERQAANPSNERLHPVSVVSVQSATWIICSYESEPGAEFTAPEKITDVASQ